MKRVQIEMEFIFRASTSILYKFFTAPSCLVRWFCDEVQISEKKFSYFWDGTEESADLIDSIENEKLVFHWDDSEDDAETLILTFKRSPVTGETILSLSDYCDEDEIDDQKQYWESLMDQLKQETGG